MITQTRLHAIRRDDMIVRAYRCMYGAVCGYIAKRIGNVADVEDMAQDVFETLLKPGRLLSEETLSRYIYSIAHNMVIDWYRRHACSIRAQEYFFAHSPISAEDSDARMCVADIMRIEKEALDGTGESARTAYVIFVHEGGNVKEIAERMGLSKRTVENHIFRTRARVREAISRAI